MLQDRCDAGVIGIMSAIIQDCMIGSLAQVVSGIVYIGGVFPSKPYSLLTGVNQARITKAKPICPFNSF